MNTSLRLLLTTMLLASCATSQEVAGPGKPTTYVIVCGYVPGLAACYRKAAEQCPGGYTVLDSRMEPSGSPMENRVDDTSSTGPVSGHPTITVSCKP